MNNLDFELEFMPYEQRDDLFVENNATRIGRREELLGPSLDANQMENFDNLQEKQVLGKYGQVIGYRSEISRR